MPEVHARLLQLVLISRNVPICPISVNRVRDNLVVDDSPDLTGGWLALAAVRFAAELGMLAGLAYVGWRLAEDSQAVALLVAVVLVAVAATVWGAWVAPRAAKRLEDPARLAVEVTLFAVTSVGLFTVGAAIPAIVLLTAYLVSTPVGRKGY
jgi:hypothetical protein